MFSLRTIKRTWPGLAQWLSQDQRKWLLALLRQEYIEEMENSIRLRGHAARMRYSQFRERLFQMAEEERKHAEWLSQTIAALGGEVPRISFVPEERSNSWEYLRLDLDQERHCIWDFEEMVAQVERIDSGIAAGLRRILKTEKGHRDALTDMLVRSDPQASGIA